MRKYLLSVSFIFFLLFESSAQHFTRVSTLSGFVGLNNARMAWGDIDNDNDADVLMSGTNASGTIVARLYRNEGNAAFTEISISLIQVYNGDLSFADYNNDNFLDFIITGTDVNNTRITRLYRNNKNGLFSPVAFNIDSVSHSVTQWLDYDKDGDADLLLAGAKGNGRKICKLFRNDQKDVFTAMDPKLPKFDQGSAAITDFNRDGFTDIVMMGSGSLNLTVDNGTQGLMEVYFGNKNGQFTAQGYGLTGLKNGEMATGDFDQDGWPDLAVSGFDDFNNVIVSKIYRNIQGQGFTTVTPGITNQYFSSMSWGDMDNDGDLDLLTTGQVTGNDKKTFLYRNDGGINFTNISTTLQEINLGQARWVDFDNDGDLDIFLSGASLGSGPLTYLYENDMSVTLTNTIPNAPTGTQDIVSEDSVKLNWNLANDGETQQKGLSYALWLTTSKDSFNIITPIADTLTGYRKIPQHSLYMTSTSGWIKNLRQSHYYWRVQAIDNGFKGSLFTAWKSFTVCTKISLGADVEVCKGKDITIRLGKGTEIVTWFTKKKGQIPGNTFNYVHTANQTDTVWARLQNGLGCSLYDTIIVKVIDVPAVSLPVTLNKCFKEPFSFNQGTATDTVFWYSNEGLIHTANTFSGIALKKDTLFIKVSSQFGCLNRDTVQIDTLPLPRFSLGSDVSLCKGQQSKTFVVAGNDTLTWYHSKTVLGFNIHQLSVTLPLESDTIMVKAKNSEGCYWADTVSVKVNPLPVADAGKDSIICFGSEHILGAVSVGRLGTPPYSYHWSPADDLNNPVIDNPVSRTSADQVYKVILTDQNGCMAWDTVSIKVNPQTIIDPGSDRAICMNDSIQTGGSPTAKNSLFPYRYQWMSPNDTFYDSPNPIVKPTQTTTYTLVVSTRNCTPDTGKVTITVHPLPIPTTDPLDGDTTIGYNESISLKAFGGREYIWFPSNGLDDPRLPFPTATLTETTQYIVQVTDSNTCQAKDTVKVFVTNQLYIANLFSPDNDTHNDQFKVLGTGIDHLILQVFDRYGQKVYDSGKVNNPKETEWTGWDGTYKGEPQPSGSYQWMLTGKFYDGKDLDFRGNKKGSVYLLR